MWNRKLKFFIARGAVWISETVAHIFLVQTVVLVSVTPVCIEGNRTIGVYVTQHLFLTSVTGRPAMFSTKAWRILKSCFLLVFFFSSSLHLLTLVHWPYCLPSQVMRLPAIWIGFYRPCLKPYRTALEQSMKKKLVQNAYAIFPLFLVVTIRNCHTFSQSVSLLCSLFWDVTQWLLRNNSRRSPFRMLRVKTFENAYSSPSRSWKAHLV